MRDRVAPLGALAALTLGLCAAGPARAANEARAVSPDGSIEARVFAEDSGLKFTVTLKGKPVIEPSPLVMRLDGVDLSDGAAFGEAAGFEVRETFPWRGVHSRATNRCNGVTVRLKHPKSGTEYTLELRAFDDAVAFRHVIPGDRDRERVPDEATRFVLPVGSTVWHHDLNGHYEGVHEKSKLADVKAGEWVAPPLTFKLPDGAGYGSITEAALADYAGMALRADGRGGFELVLGHAHPVSYPYKLRYTKEDIDRLAKPATVRGTVTTPWRVVMLGTDLNALVNCDAVAGLCPPPDKNLFPDGLAADWVKPGRAVWKYLDGGESTYEGMKEFCRLAGELGFEYCVIEGFWSRWSDDELRSLVKYGKERGVGLWLWKHCKDLREPEARKAFFRKCREAGVVGVKLDFFDHEAKEVIDLYQALLREAAEDHLMVNFHGSNKPTGEPRTWPNELVREAVKGMEASKLQNRARHDATLPFTRLLAGHADYTPVHFGPRRGDTTWAHQVATAAVFTAPLLTYAAHPKTLLESPCAPMIKSIPAVWDETVVLPGSEVGEAAVFARRSGDSWFLAVVNGPEGRTLRVPLSFLGEGEYRTLFVRDQKDDPAAVKVEEGKASRGDVVEINLHDGGGFVGRFSRN